MDTNKSSDCPRSDLDEKGIQENTSVKLLSSSANMGYELTGTPDEIKEGVAISFSDMALDASDTSRMESCAQILAPEESIQGKVQVSQGISLPNVNHEKGIEGQIETDVSSVMKRIEELQKTVKELQGTVKSLKEKLAPEGNEDLDLNAPMETPPGIADTTDSTAAWSHDAQKSIIEDGNPIPWDSTAALEFFKPSRSTTPPADTTSQMGDEEGSQESESHSEGESSGKLVVYREVKVKDRNSYGKHCYVDVGDRSWMKRHNNSKDYDYPMVSRRVFNRGGTHLKTVLRFNSQILLEALKETLPPKRCQGYTELFSTKAKMHKPYILFYQNRQALEKGVDTYSKNGLSEKAALIRMLLDFLEEDEPSTWEKLDQLDAKECNEISFQDVWLLYQPRTTVFVERSGIWEAFKVERVTAEQFPAIGTLMIHAYHLDFDDKGKGLIPAKTILTQPPFAGDRLICNLKVIPDAYLQGHSEIVKKLIERGKSFWSFGREPAYRQYEGDAWPKTSSGSNIKVVIDYVTSSACNERSEDEDSDDEYCCDCSICVKNYAGLASYGKYIQTASNICPRDRAAVRPDIPYQYCEDEASLDNISIFCPSKAWAFSLKHKSWNRIEVNEISDVPRETKPFEKLILHPEHKSIVESMVETRLSNTLTDLIKEKGRGLVILIHGAPGTGKTLTAECVAEKEHKPLYMVTCGDLGTVPNELEKRLEEIFLRAVNWKAVLLLDEADVFLQERDLHDLNRNALVSVFLRHIEYYDGVIFLTTNRPGQIDEAFQSRIHVTLGLPELNWDSQKKIWSIFINRLKFNGTIYSKDDRLELLKFIQDELEDELKDRDYQMNGRQIRNCLRTASAIANKHDRIVKKEDIISVIDLGRNFKDYIRKLHKMNEEERVASLGVRVSTSK